MSIWNPRHGRMSSVGSVLAGTVLATLMLSSCGVAGSKDKNASNGEPIASECPSQLNSYLSAGPTMPVTTAMFTSIPKELGYWDEVGPEVKSDRESGGNLALVQRFAAADGIDIAGLTGTGALLLSNQGKEFKGILATVPVNFNTVRVLASSDVRTAADLAGKRIGVLDPESSSVPLIKGMLKSNGIDSKSVSFVGVGIGQTALKALLDGQVDALGLYDSAWAPDGLWPDGYREVMAKDAAKIGPGVMAVVRHETLRDCKDELIEYGKAIVKATLFAQENPKMAVRIHWKHYPETKPAGVDEAEALKTSVDILERRTDLYVKVDGLWGDVSPEMWQASIDNAIDGGVLDESIDVDKVWDSSLVKAMNEFDEAELRETARNYVLAQ